jgi:hypothetical protein
MNIKQLIAATAAVFVTGSVFAQQTYPYVDFSVFQGTKTRAEVMQELQASEANGNYVVGGHEYVAPAAGFVSSKRRAQVLAELQQAEADGLYALAHQEYQGQFPRRGGNAGTQVSQNGAASNAN